MRSRRLRQMRRAMILGAGVVFAGVGECLPKDYWYNFAGVGRTQILNAFADSLFTSVTDTLFPAPPEEDTTGG